MADLEQETMWMKSVNYQVRNGGVKPDLLSRVKRNLESISKKLPTPEKLDPDKIRQILEELKSGSKYAQSRIKGEPAHIVTKEDEVLGITEIGLAHMAGLRHRTTNAFVVTPAGNLICQRRVHNKRFPLYLSIYGGHLIAPLHYQAGMEEELREEINLPNEPEGEFVWLGKDLYEELGDLNSEIRALYVYRLTPAEYELVRLSIEEIASTKKGMTLAQFELWIEGEQKKRSGCGEIWGVYEVGVESLMNAQYGATYDSDLKKTVELHYINVVDHFVDQSKEDRAYFTPDLLERAIRNSEVVRALHEATSGTFGGAR